MKFCYRGKTIGCFYPISRAEFEPTFPQCVSPSTVQASNEAVTGVGRNCLQTSIKSSDVLPQSANYAVSTAYFCMNQECGKETVNLKGMGKKCRGLFQDTISEFDWND
jgi:hypothetical protein